MNNPSNPPPNSSGQQPVGNQSVKDKNNDKKTTDKSDYVYNLPNWDLMPPATFVIRRVHRL